MSGQLRLKELDAVCGDAGLVLSGANHLLADAKKALNQSDLVLLKCKRPLDMHFARVQENAKQLRSHGPAPALDVVVPLQFALDPLRSFGAVGALGTFSAPFIWLVSERVVGCVDIQSNSRSCLSRLCAPLCCVQALQ